MATFDDIAQLIAMTKAAFPNWKADEDTGSFWFTMLRDLLLDDLFAAVMSLSSEPDRVFAPSIGEIRGKVVALKARQSGVPGVYQAWEELLNAPPDGIVRREPYWSEEEQTWVIEKHKYRWSHPLVEVVARRLGWPGRFPGENLGVSLAHFRSAYEAAYMKELSLAAEPGAVTAYMSRESMARSEIAKLAASLDARQAGSCEEPRAQPGTPD